ncbi:RHS repeat-associated core domain-containing protein [Massilia pseudoviolaceinigra]|uniref:RHS repeat-associated core domain-containing protein n=1 Tax=Massilia pseudoviolaceinigra TaxID=3057165 RepID=UPI002796833F|nr:RHS repeat-associated core domain-containing protein [Massilia sp. CCM 9206]MDQ1920563.1 RHS repeat-associated core domain-containing protein [Massilia sp. CCM 9206]
MIRRTFSRLTSGALIVVMTYTPLLGSYTGTVASAQSVPAGTTSYKYDLVGNLKEVTAPLGRVTTHTYDSFNRLKQVEQPLTDGARPTVKYGYDGIDQLATVTDPRNLETRYSVDGLGNRTELGSPDTGLTKSTYDAAGNLKTSTFGSGYTNTYFYDALNRLIRINYTITIGTTFEYDGGATPTPNARGKMTLMTDESGYTRYTYGEFGRLATKAQTTTGLGSYTNTHTLAYAYDAYGRLASVTYPSGNRVNYGYNQAGQVTSITLNPVKATGTDTNIDSSIVLLNNITYAPFGGTTGWTWGNSVPANQNAHVRTYDLDGRISSYTLGNPSGNGVVRTVNYDAASRIKAYTHTGASTVPSPASLNQTFGYDELNRLTSYSGNGTSQTYAYDASGNRIKASFGANTYKNTIDPLSNKLSAATGPGPAKTNVYNGVGDRTTDGTHVITYSGRARPYRNQNGAVTTHQLFNGLDQRVFQTYGGGIFVYDEQGQLVGEYSYLNGKATRETVYLGNLPVAVLTQTVTGTAPAQSTAINVFHIHPDHLGTPRMITRTLDNKIVWRWDSGDPFGLTPPIESFTGSGTFTFNLRMPGQYYDRSTNLFYNYFRDYDPQTGRYVQSDPIGLRGGLNTYAYVGGNPLSSSDPLGLETVIVLSGGILSNPFGHIGIATTGQGVFSYGTAYGYGSSLTDYVADQLTERDVTLITMNTTPGQEKAIVDAMNEFRKRPYSASSNNCADAVVYAMGKAGIGGGSARGPMFPRIPSLVGQAQPGATTKTIYQGGSVPPGITIYNPK